MVLGGCRSFLLLITTIFSGWFAFDFLELIYAKSYTFCGGVI